MPIKPIEALKMHPIVQNIICEFVHIFPCGRDIPEYYEKVFLVLPIYTDSFRFIGSATEDTDKEECNKK